MDWDVIVQKDIFDLLRKDFTLGMERFDNALGVAVIAASRDVCYLLTLSCFSYSLNVSSHFFYFFFSFKCVFIDVDHFRGLSSLGSWSIIVDFCVVCQ